MRKRSVGLLACMIATWLPSCGVSGLVHLTGLGIARRHEAAIWTRASSPHDSASAKPARPLLASKATGVAGRFSLLTYNVAGLPQLVSPSTPRVNIPLVSPLLNAYDVALVQEDFSYHHELVDQARHAYRSTPMRPRSFVGDGLNQFSRFEFGGLQRVRWDRCNGYVSSATDCLADKGFSFSELALASGSKLHLYNLHADAGQGRLDVETRALNFEQLADYIERHSAGEAVIVAGDTNLRTFDARDAQTLANFLATSGLRDACRLQACRNIYGEEPIDRVMFRSSSHLALAVVRLREDADFVDGQGAALSDHPAMGADLTWQRSEPGPLVAQLGTP